MQSELTYQFVMELKPGDRAGGGIVAKAFDYEDRFGAICRKVEIRNENKNYPFGCYTAGENYSGEWVEWHSY